MGCFGASLADASNFCIACHQTCEGADEDSSVAVAITSLNGFPPITGIEAYKIKTKTAASTRSLFDRADDHLLVDCGSLLFRQTPLGDILYPDTEAFTSFGLVRTRYDATVEATATDHVDLVDGGLFSSVCSSVEGPLRAGFGVVVGALYSVSLYWVITMCATLLLLASPQAQLEVSLCPAYMAVARRACARAGQMTQTRIQLFSLSLLTG